jgi:hypothetical protein
LRAARLLLIALRLGSVTAPACATDNWDGVLPKSGIACYGRDNDAAHLARVPGQKIDRMRIVITDSIVAHPTHDYPSTWFWLVIGYSLRGGSGETWQVAHCDSGPEGPSVPIACKVHCYGHGAEFTLSPEGRDGLRLEFASEGGRPFCADDKFTGGPQDRVFALRKLPVQQCALIKRQGGRP